MEFYWYTTCRNCNHQGRLILMKNMSADRLYLHCEECESGWYDPLEIDKLNAKFLTIDKDFTAVPASLDDIEKAGWQHFAKNEVID